jgi:UDP-N-acetylmuramate dehydrogenase
MARMDLCPPGRYYRSVASVGKLATKIKLRGRVAAAEPMRAHTSFRLGGPADLYLVPSDPEDLAAALSFLRNEGVPVFLLGGGTNLLVADRGIRGAVVDLTAIRGLEAGAGTISALCGTLMDDAVGFARDRSLSGLEFAASLPGSVGGAVWMNARCYEREIADVLESVESLDDGLVLRRRSIEPGEWGYKRSPFQSSSEVIVRAVFRLSPGDPRTIDGEMRRHRQDREAKGHFLHPCAGSVFKNDRSFGKPTGRLIDELGLKGLRAGGARVAPYHGNIIVNLGDATAADVRALIERVEREVADRLGLRLEREVILAGDWRD